MRSTQTELEKMMTQYFVAERVLLLDSEDDYRELCYFS